MKQLKILIVDDDFTSVAYVKASLESKGHKITAIVSNMREAESALKHSIVDLAIVEITLEGSSYEGIYIVENLLQAYRIPVIYLTNVLDSSIVQEALKTQPLAYMLKPLREEELAIQVELAFLNHRIQSKLAESEKMSESLFLPTDQGKRHVKIQKNDVIYMSASGAYTEIHSLSEGVTETFVFSMNLGYLEQYFKSLDFFRLSRSLIVNLRFIKTIETNYLHLKGINEPIKYPESNRTELLSRLNVLSTYSR